MQFSRDADRRRLRQHNKSLSPLTDRAAAITNFAGVARVIRKTVSSPCAARPRYSYDTVPANWKINKNKREIRARSPPPTTTLNTVSRRYPNATQ